MPTLPPVDGDPLPEPEGGSFDRLANSELSLSSADLLAFGTGLRYHESSPNLGSGFAALRIWAGADSQIVSRSGDLVPVPIGGAVPTWGITTFALGDGGELAFDEGLGSGDFSSGVFITSPSRSS